jgi:hypothetical protein
VIGDTGKNFAEIGLGIEAVKSGCAGQGVEDGGAFAATVGASEEVVLASERDTAQGAFGGRVVDLDYAIVDFSPMMYVALRLQSATDNSYNVTESSNVLW